MSDRNTDVLVDALNSIAGTAPDSEESLAEVVSLRLREAGIPHLQEVWLNDTDRVDLLVGRTCVELKITGPVNAITRQLSRYAQSDQVDALILVTTRMAHRSVPSSLNRKPVTVVYVGGWT